MKTTPSAFSEVRFSQLLTQHKRGTAPLFTGVLPGDSVKFGNAPAQPPAAVTPVTPVAKTPEVKAPEIKPEDVKLETNVLTTLSLVVAGFLLDPATTWPYQMIRELTNNDEVAKYLSQHCSVKALDIHRGAAKVMEELAKVPDIRNTGAKTLNEALPTYYSNVMGPSMKTFAAKEGYKGDKKMNIVEVWRWLIKANPEAKVEEWLKSCDLDPKAIASIKAAPSIFVPEAVATAPRLPTRKELIAFKKTFQKLPKIVIGQDDALKDLVGGIQVATQGVSLNKDKPNRPQVRFLLMGPSGVGKTFTAKKMAELLGRPVIVVPCNQYQDSSAVNNFQGSAQGFVGSEEANRLREIKRAVEDSQKNGTPPPLILFDELEKAHVDFRKAIMQMLDEGVMFTSDTKQVIFRDCAIMFTSNVAQKPIAYIQSRGEDVLKAMWQDLSAKVPGLNEEPVSGLSKDDVEQVALALRPMVDPGLRELLEITRLLDDKEYEGTPFTNEIKEGLPDLVQDRFLKALYEKKALNPLLKSLTEEQYAKMIHHTMKVMINEMLDEVVTRRLDNTFTPDFKGRINKKIIFKSLTEKAAKTILNMQENGLKQAFSEGYGINLTIEDSLQDQVFKKGFTFDSGVRELESQLQRYVYEPLIQKISDIRIGDNPDDEDAPETPIRSGEFTCSYRNSSVQVEFTPPTAEEIAADAAAQVPAEPVVPVAPAPPVTTGGPEKGKKAKA